MALSASSQPTSPVVPSAGALRPLGVDAIVLDDGLWGHMQRLNTEAVIEHCLEWVERIGWMGNFDRIAGHSSQTHTGIEFVDSEVYKLLEAIAWELGRRPDAELEGRFEALVARVAAAQDPDGYLDTAFGHTGQRPRYSDLVWGHELYCFGHLIQAAVARVRTGHDDLLVATTRRLVEHLWSEFGPEGRDAICGHPEIEVALAEYSRATGDTRALELARLFLERRGRRTISTTLYQGSDYFLDDVPVREATVLRGHAVRALYFAAGAIDIAVETGDEELRRAVEGQYAQTVERRSYITGGMGAHHQNEEFGVDYELPADRAYAETCASIASVMTAWRLLLVTGDEEYADQIERTLLNAVFASPRADGRAFYYANTLHQRVRATADEQDDGLSERAEAVLRAPWFEVSCCPTNVARTLASMGVYVATAHDSGIQLHQYTACTVRAELPDGAPLTLRVNTAYPENGTISVVVVEAPDRPVTLTLRVPRWARGAATLDGRAVPADAASVSVTRGFAVGDVVTLELPMVPRVITPHPQVDAVRGQVAVEWGPLVLALEDVDLPGDRDVESVVIDTTVAPTATAEGVHVRLHDRADREIGFDARLIAYKDWANRGSSTMRVWMPTS